MVECRSIVFVRRWFPVAAIKLKSMSVSLQRQEERFRAVKNSKWTELRHYLLRKLITVTGGHNKTQERNYVRCLS